MLMRLPSIQAAGNRFVALDVVRGLAVLLVVLAHYAANLAPGSAIERFSGDLGFFGVLLFFNLSGFLIYRNVEQQSWQTFLSRRFFKIFPAYWVNVLVIVLLMFPFQLPGSFSGVDFLSNIFMVQEFTHSPLANGVYWTLQIEVKFYLILALVRFFNVKQIYGLWAVLLLVNIVTYLVLGRGSVLVTCMVMFFPGIAIANAVEREWSPVAIAEVAIVTAITCLDTFLLPSLLPSHGPLWVAIGAALIVLAIRSNFRLPLFPFFGAISYSLYLYHDPVSNFLLSPSVSHWIGLSGPSLAWLALAASIGVSFLSFRWIEKPSIAFGRRLETQSFLPPIKGDLANSAKGRIVVSPPEGSAEKPDACRYLSRPSSGEVT